MQKSLFDSNYELIWIESCRKRQAMKKQEQFRINLGNVEKNFTKYDTYREKRKKRGLKGN